jgi:hypothetical protein
MDEASRQTDLPLIAECRLDLDGLRAQRNRYGRIGQRVERLERRPQHLDLWLTPDADTDLVRETIAIERDCCPFYETSFSLAERRLSLSVADTAQDLALDAIHFAITGTESSPAFG